MYKVSIPINCDKFYRTTNKQLLLDELKAFDADRVMLNFETSLDGHILVYNQEDYQRQIDRMSEACAFFKSHGYEVGAWFWGLRFDEQFSFTQIKTLGGRTVNLFACPTDKNLLKTIQKCLVDVAKTGVDIILLNDDLRFGAWGGFGCVCDNHIKMIRDELGEDVDVEKLRELILNGGKNKYRDALLKANRISLENYAIQARKAVDTINPNIRLGFCACMTSWDIDGDAFKLAKLFAGKTKPILRLIGAPYWSAGKKEENRLQNIIELERMEASWNSYPEIELIAEGDVYPRPRLNCAASYLEGFDTALRASGAVDGIMKICIDYVSNVDYENGYRKLYLKNKPIYQAIKKYFDNKKSTGIRVYESKNKVSVMQIPNALGTHSDMEETFYSSAARILCSNAIPTTYEGSGVTGIVFGENAYELNEDCLNNGLIIDALAAKILSERGFDVGINNFGSALPMTFQYINDDNNYIIADYKSVFNVDIKPNAQIISYAAQTFEKNSIPFCYKYQNEKGQKFLVFNCIAKESEMLLRHYANAKIITDNIQWLSKNSLPAFCYGHPNLYIQCKEDEKTLVVGIWNFFEDEVIEPVVQLGQTYKSAEFLFGSGTLLGKTVKLSDIPPFAFRAIVLNKI